MKKQMSRKSRQKRYSGEDSNREGGYLSTYVTSDIHGQYEMYMDLLKRIRFSREDYLYVIGDVLDRGEKPIETLLYIMNKDNMKLILGNHESMAKDCLKFYTADITSETVRDLNDEMLKKLRIWSDNGNRTTLDGFKSIKIDVQKEIIKYLNQCPYYEEIIVNESDYLLVHAGLDNFSAQRRLESYSLEELVWTRRDYKEKYFDDKIVISGHTPTQLIRKNKRPGYIYIYDNSIDIDCGAYLCGGRLAALCLETGEEFYSDE